MGTVLLFLLLRVDGALGGLSWLWSRHEHKRIGSRDEIISFNAQDILADPTNLHVEGSEEWIACLFEKAGWTKADALSVRSAIEIAASLLINRAYPQAPVNSLYFHDRVQSLAFQRYAG